MSEEIVEEKVIKKKPRKKVAKKKVTKKSVVRKEDKIIYDNFIREYISNGRNATKAYLAVKPKAATTTARTEGCKLLAKPYVSGFLTNYYQKLWETKDAEIGKAFSDLVKLAGSDISDVVEYDEQGGMIIKDFDDVDTSIIQSISEHVTQTKFGANVNKTIKLHDKTKALSELIRVLGMITEKHKVSVHYDKDAAEEIQEIFNEQISGKKNN